MTQNAKTMNPEETPTEETPLTAGQQYVQDFLPELSENIDPGWFAEQIDGGSLLACPRCSFLHLPFLVFPDPCMARRGIPEPVDACNVCAALPDTCRFPLEGVPSLNADPEAALTAALFNVAGERRMRAETLWHLSLGAANSADALFVARMAQAGRDLARLARTPLAEAGGAKLAGGNPNE